jgi:hypothetical protein
LGWCGFGRVGQTDLPEMQLIVYRGGGWWVLRCAQDG